MEVYIKGGLEDKIAFLIILLVFIAVCVVCKIKWWLEDRRKQMKVVAEFEKPTKCEDCPCFYQTEGAWRDECQLTHKEIENYFIVDESCPLKVKENYE